MQLTVTTVNRNFPMKAVRLCLRVHKNNIMVFGIVRFRKELFGSRTTNDFLSLFNKRDGICRVGRDFDDSCFVIDSDMLHC